jgi:hypothetical protein
MSDLCLWRHRAESSLRSDDCRNMWRILNLRLTLIVFYQQIEDG